MQLFLGFAITRKHDTFLSIFISFYNFVLSDIKFIENEKELMIVTYPFSCSYVVMQYVELSILESTIKKRSIWFDCIFKEINSLNNSVKCPRYYCIL